ncbi:MAG: HAD family phosphatase [Anaerolineaceae bacterium]|nr:HAD family phosphatase [Anaerolineaceae bacterium]
MCIKAVIWDMGGVIMRTQDPEPRSKLAERYGLTRAGLEKIIFGSDSAQLAEAGKITGEQHWRNMSAQFSLDEVGLADFQTSFWGGDRADGELVEYIRSLRPQYRTALLSNAWSTARLEISQAYDVLDAFDLSIFSAEVNLAKPDPAIFRLAIERLGILPQEAIFVDDFIANVEAAARLGIHAVQFHNTAQAHGDVDALLRRSICA